MRKIDPRDFQVATRTTSRDINRRIALNLIREHQPISRADLARRMNVTRGAVSVLVQELIDQDVIYVGATGETLRGRKPTFLHIRTHDRLAIAVDIRFSKTYLMLSDLSGRQLALESYDTIFSVPAFVKPFILNHNMHRVHHRHPLASWASLPALFEADKDNFDSALIATGLKQLKGPMRRPVQTLAEPEIHQAAE